MTKEDLLKRWGWIWAAHAVPALSISICSRLYNKPWGLLLVLPVVVNLFRLKFKVDAE